MVAGEADGSSVTSVAAGLVGSVEVSVGAVAVDLAVASVDGVEAAARPAAGS